MTNDKVDIELKVRKDIKKRALDKFAEEIKEFLSQFDCDICCIKKITLKEIDKLLEKHKE